MAYQEFAYFYDEFNGAADYDALFAYVTGELKAHGIQDGIVADFGCGTGELTLMLAQAGYDMIGIDVSEEMLSVLRDKADALGLPLTNPMLLCQDLLQLDLYGTIRAAVSTFDTYNHIGPLENFEKAIAKAAFFMEKDGVFVFDLNTPYKHEKVLSGQTFDFDEDDAACRWSNRYDPQTGRVDLSIDIHYKDTGEDFHESFSEYSYPLDTVKALLTRYGFDPVKIADGESFGPVRPDSQRWIITAVKQYTQEADGTPADPPPPCFGRSLILCVKQKMKTAATCCAAFRKTAASCSMALIPPPLCAEWSSCTKPAPLPPQPWAAC